MPSNSSSVYPEDDPKGFQGEECVRGEKTSSARRAYSTTIVARRICSGSSAADSSPKPEPVSQIS